MDFSHGPLHSGPSSFVVWPSMDQHDPPAAVGQGIHILPYIVFHPISAQIDELIPFVHSLAFIRVQLHSFVFHCLRSVLILLKSYLSILALAHDPSTPARQHCHLVIEPRTSSPHRDGSSARAAARARSLEMPVMLVTRCPCTTHPTVATMFVHGCRSLQSCI